MKYTISIRAQNDVPHLPPDCSRFSVDIVFEKDSETQYGSFGMVAPSDLLDPSMCEVSAHRVASFIMLGVVAKFRRGIRDEDDSTVDPAILFYELEEYRKIAPAELEVVLDVQRTDDFSERVAWPLQYPVFSLPQHAHIDQKRTDLGRVAQQVREGVVDPSAFPRLKF